MRHPATVVQRPLTTVQMLTVLVFLLAKEQNLGKLARGKSSSNT